MRASHQYLPQAKSALSLSSEAYTMICRAFLTTGLASLIVCLVGSRLGAADAPGAGPVDHATIYFSSAPWDGAAYDIEIPLERVDDGAQPYIRINIWGYPEFPDPKAIHFWGAMSWRHWMGRGSSRETSRRRGATSRRRSSGEF
jgi:hypothetical protein